MVKNNLIVVTGGGSGGHVVPNLPIIKRLQKLEYEVVYVGSYDGIEKEIVAKNTSIEYKGIYSGKLRRYLDWKNVRDIFYILFGCVQAFFFFLKRKPLLVFSKGGFVSVPVVISSWLLGIPVIIHEADMTMGLANRIASLFVRHVCFSFKLPSNHQRFRSYLTGLPLRDEVYCTSLSNEILKKIGVSEDFFQKKILLVFGGSLGARSINNVIAESLRELTEKYIVVHLVGKGNLFDVSKDESILKKYFQYEYLDGLPELIARADMVVTRAGSNSIFELLAMKKPALYIPLTRAQSRGDQIENVAWILDHNFGHVLYEENLKHDTFLSSLNKLEQEYENIKNDLSSWQQVKPADEIVKIIERVASEN